MANNYFKFKQFTIRQEHTAMKVTTDGCLLGAWAAANIISSSLKADNVLDIGTGTGLLSLMLAQKTNGQIDAVELEPNAGRQAAENIKSSPYADRITVAETDIRNYVSDRKYDIIISNPPFYETDLRSGNREKDLAHHGAGLSLTELVSEILARLRTNGHFFLLLPFRREAEARLIISQAKVSIISMEQVRPTAGHAPFRLLVHGTNTEHHHPVTTDHSIRDADNNYTPWFIDLLRDYYLHL